MATELVALTERHRDLVDQLVARGRFPTAKAAVAQAIDLLLEDEMEWQAFLERINRAYEEDTAARSTADPDRMEAAVRMAFRQSRQSYAGRKQDARRQDGPEEPE